MISRPARTLCRLLCFATLISLGDLRTAAAHPHVFVEGGVSFILDEEQRLTALEVTWHYDLFETLFVLSSIKVTPQPDGGLTPEDRQKISDFMTDWPPEYKGSAHLSHVGEDLELVRPSQMEVALIDGKLVMRFERDLADPISMPGQVAEVGFYESTYYYAFTVTEPTGVLGAGKDSPCSARVIPFDPNADLEALQVSLFDLGREDIPEEPNVGALFADRIELACD